MKGGTKKKLKKGKKISIMNLICIIILIILIPIICISIIVFIDSVRNKDEIPSFFGWKPFIVLSDSMEKTINTGDLAITKEVDPAEIAENDIISYKTKDNIVITHRVVGIQENNGEKYYITKGDNNSQNDEGLVTEKQIEGKYQFKLNGLGNVAMFIQTPIGMLISLGTPLMLLIVLQNMDKRKKETKN